MFERLNRDLASFFKPCKTAHFRAFPRNSGDYGKGVFPPLDSPIVNDLFGDNGGDMKIRSFSVRPGNQFETLEQRMLFATTYDFGKLTGYGLSGHSWTYDNDYSLTSNIFNDISGSGQSTVSVKRQGTGTPTTLKIMLGVGPGKETLITQRDANGTTLTEIDTSFGSGKFKLKLGSTLLAPKTMTLKQTYTDKGTFSGSFSGSVEGTDLSGQINGKTTTTATLSGNASVSTPAGDFSAIKGNYSVKLTGTLKAKINGFGVNVDFSESLPLTFWAVNNFGIVKSQGTLSTSLKAVGQTATVNVKNTATLVDANPPVAQSLIVVNQARSASERNVVQDILGT
jgi:hypothetical protein